MANKSNKKHSSEDKVVSLQPQLREKSTHPKVLMAKESFIVTHKSEPLYNKDLIELASRLASEQSQQIRTVFSQINKSNGKVPSDKSVSKSFGISTTESRNVIKSAESIYKSQSELLEGQYIPNVKRDISSLKSQIKTLKNKLVKEYIKQQNKNTPKRARRINRARRQLSFLHNKLNKNTQKAPKLLNNLEDSQFSVCFGSKKLMRQFNNSLNIFKNENLSVEERIDAYKEYEEKKSKWQFDRDSEYFAEGHSVQKSGNSRVQLFQNNDTFKLKVNVPDQFQNEFGKTVEVDGVYYGDGRRFDEVSHAIRNIKVNGRNRAEYPVTQRLKLVQTKYGVGVQVITSIHIRKAEIISDRRNGAMGVDFNQHSLDWGIVDYYGNPIATGKIALSTQDRNSEQTKDQVSKAASELFEIATKWGVPIYFEDLSFKNNSERFKSKGKKFSRMASNLPFATFKELVQQKSYRTGIAIGFVNPAFTSIQGLYKYMVKYGLSSGTAAGVVIARRGLGFNKEKIPQSVINVNAGLFPGDNTPAVNTTGWSDWGKVSRSRKSVGKRARHKFFGLTCLMGANCSNEEENSPSAGGLKDSSLQEKVNKNSLIA